MIGYAKELGLTVKNARLMTREELETFQDEMPEVSSGICWWLSDVDTDDDCYIAYAEGNYTEDDMYCERDESNTYIRVALDIDDISDTDLEAGDEFIHCGFVFTVLDDSLAISNNFIGCAKYYDENIADCMLSDDEITCTLDGILQNLFEESADVEVYNIIPDDVRSQLEVVDLDDED